MAQQCMDPSASKDRAASLLHCIQRSFSFLAFLFLGFFFFLSEDGTSLGQHWGPAFPDLEPNLAFLFPPNLTFFTGFFFTPNLDIKT
jgi:hypothetical protein